jgi:chlorobactene glucosyltransferase
MHMQFTVWDGVVLLVALALSMGLLNVIANIAFNRFARRKAAGADAMPTMPMVSVLVPARNEARNIEVCIASLLQQDYANCEVIALDDDSSDDTGGILNHLAAHDSKLRVLHNRAPLPAGVNGKSRACTLLAKEARGDWLLFVDADTVHQPNAIREGITRAIGLNVALFSAIPRQITDTWGERLFIPAGFALIYNGVSMWRMWRSQQWQLGNAAAIGQYLLVKRDAYEAAGGHAAIQDKILDDVFMGVHLKRNGHRIAITDGPWVACRMYRGFNDMVQGFSKNAFAILQGSIPLSIVFIAFTLAVFFLPLVLWAAGVAPVAAPVAIMLTLLNLMLVNMRIGQPAILALLYPIQLLVGIGILLNSIRWRVTGKVVWKGRVLEEIG